MAQEGNMRYILNIIKDVKMKMVGTSKDVEKQVNGN